MSTEPAPGQMSRDELEEEVADLRSRVADLSRDMALVRQCFDALVDEENLPLDELPEALRAEFDESVTGVNREHLLPAHRMWLDIEAGDGDTLADTQRRAALLFAQFLNRVVEDESTKADASGQKFTLTSGKAQEVLVEAGEFEGVAEQSRSTITARVMREVQRLTKVEDCDCEDIDACDHGLVRFRPGRPHSLGGDKERFTAAMHNAYQRLGDADDADETPDSSVEDSTREDAEQELDALSNATRGA